MFRMNNFLSIRRKNNSNLIHNIPEDTRVVTPWVLPSSIPEKSRTNYESAYTRFEKWCEENNKVDVGEDTMLSYFEDKSKVLKSSSLWAQFSMLRAVISFRNNVDIRKYVRLLAFLKKNAVGYRATKAKMLNKQEINTFLKDADDHTYLLMKVAMIIGVAGACSRDELSYMHSDDVRDEGSYFRITITNSHGRDQREFIILDETVDDLNLAEIIRKYIGLRPLVSRRPIADQLRFFIAYRNGKCTNQPVGVNTIGIYPKKVASFLGLPDPESYTGYRYGKLSRHGGTKTGFTNEYDEHF